MRTLYSVCLLLEQTVINVGKERKLNELIYYHGIFAPRNAILSDAKGLMGAENTFPKP